MTDRDPGRIYMRATPDLDASSFSLRVEVVLPGIAGDSPAFRDAVELFVAAANAGAFGGQRFPSTHSAARVTAWPQTAGATVNLACRELERGAVRVLANLLRRSLGDAAAPVRAIIASGPDDRLATASTVGVDALPYPLAPEQTPFDVDIESPERSLDPLHLRLTFADDLSQEDFDSAGEHLRLWIELVGRGAYLDPDAEPAGVPDASEAEIYLLSSAQIEATLYGFAADDEAFDGLIGFLMRVGPALSSRLLSVQAW
jgi:hypothetical protein